MEDAMQQLYDKARELCIKEGKMSAARLQRLLRIGYGRAARLMDMLLENGVLGPAPARYRKNPTIITQ